MPTRSRELLRAAILMLLAGSQVSVAQPPSMQPSDEELATLRQAADEVAAAIVRVEAIRAGDRSVGSGTLVDSRGYVLTAAERVGENPTGVLVTLADGTRHGGEVVARDHSRGLALLRIDADTELPAADLSSSPPLAVGQWTVAVGRPYAGDQPMVSIGILSATGRHHGRAIQTDARIAPGLYGGPLIDAAGNMLGITIPVEAPGLPTGELYDSGIGFAVPTDQIARRLERLKNGEDLHRGRLGIVTGDADSYALGTKIAGVQPQSPAAQSGLKSGDEILQIDGQTVRRFVEIQQVLGPRDAGEMVSLTIRRDGQQRQIDVELAESIPPYRPLEIGALAARVDDQVTIVSVLPEAPAAAALEPGMRLVKVAGVPVETVAEARLQIQMLQAGEPSELTIEDEASSRTVAVSPRAIPATLPPVPGPLEADEDGGNEWKTEDLALPGDKNSAKIFGPTSDADDDGLGLLVVLPGPQTTDLDAVLTPLQDVAQRSGVVLAAISSVERDRWTPTELETVVNVVAAARKLHPIRQDRVALLGTEGGGTMALISAFAKADVFRGVAVSDEVTVPPMRVGAGDPSRVLQVLVRKKADAELPEWAASLGEQGYAIRAAAASDNSALMYWNQLLGGI